MPEHYPKNTTGVMKFCNKCNRNTFHKVSGKKIGLCMEVHNEGMSEKQKKAAAQVEEEPGLF